jgi:serine/threonine-protein kinase
MGQVWAARRTGRLGLPQIIAIKTALPGAVTGTETTEEVFFDEARVAAAIDHPNVCRVYELGEDAGVLYIAMEWIDGVTLSGLMSARTKPRHLAPEMAAYIVANACAGLHAAHELTDEDGVPLEVIHRDATAQNILVSVNGAVKVVDFGIVKSRDQAHQLTVTGQLKGKFSYFAPEQVLGKSYDRRVDIFALGCVLYFLATGVRAFTGNNPAAIMMKIVKGEFVAPSRRLPGFPPELEAILVKALALRKEHRYSTAREMQQALEIFIQSGELHPTAADLAQLVRDTVGAAVEKRRAEIRESLKFFESQSKVCVNPARGGSVVRQAPESLGVAPIGHSPLPPNDAASGRPYTLTPLPFRPPLQRRVYRSAAALASAAAVGVAIWWGISSAVASRVNSDPVPGGPATIIEANRLRPGADESQPAAVPVKTVALEIRTSPAGATLRLDDGPEFAGPHTLRVPADEELHRLVASAPGFLSLEQSVRLDQSQTITLKLKKRVRRRRRPVTPAGSATASAEAQPPVETESKPMMDLPKSAGVPNPSGPKHAIDFSDPFVD